MVEDPSYIDTTLTLVQRQLVSLIRFAITVHYDHVLEVCKIDWEKLYQEAEKQSIVGICWAGIEKLPKDRLPDMDLLMEWLGQAEYIKTTHEQHVEVLKKVHGLLESEGISHVFMKGLTCGVRYPQPELRTCGDIDFVVSAKDFGRTLDALEKIGTVDRDLVHEHHGMAHIPFLREPQDKLSLGQVPDVTIEPHYKVHNYQNGRNDREMQRMFEEVFPDGLVKTMVDGYEVPVFPREFEGMFLVSHMVNHVYEEGLGLRQVIDFAYWLKSLPPSGVSEVSEFHDSGVDLGLYFDYLERMHMTRAARIFTRICEKYLGVDHGIIGYGYEDKEIVFADKMMADIMTVGNFGRGTDYGKEKGAIGSMKNYFMITHRCLRLAYLCPSEAYHWPISKFTRFFGKKMGTVGVR